MRPDPYKQARSRAYQARHGTKISRPRSSKTNETENTIRAYSETKTSPIKIDEKQNLNSLDDTSEGEEEDSAFDVETVAQLSALLSTKNLNESISIKKLEKISGKFFSTDDIRRQVLRVIKDHSVPCDKEVPDLPPQFVDSLKAVTRLSNTNSAKKLKEPPYPLVELISSHTTGDGDQRIVDDEKVQIANDENEEWLDSVL